MSGGAVALFGLELDGEGGGLAVDDGNGGDGFFETGLGGGNGVVAVGEVA